MPRSSDPELKRALRVQLSDARARAAAREPAEHEGFVRRAVSLLGGLDVVAIYLATGTELSLDATFEALRDVGVSVCVPRVVSRAIGIEMVRCDEIPATMGAFGIREPVAGSVVSPARIDASLIPGLGFDITGGRLGYGGGFYDRYLPALRQDALRIGVCYECQLRDELPVEAHDVRVTHIMTESRAFATDAAGKEHSTWTSSSE